MLLFTPLLVRTTQALIDLSDAGLVDQNAGIVQATDSSPSENHAINGAFKPTYSATGAPDGKGWAIFAGASSQTLTINALAQFVNGTAQRYAVALRYYRDELAATAELWSCGKNSAGGGQHSLRIAPGNRLQFRSKLDAGTTETVTVAGAPTVGWHWALLVVDGTNVTLHTDQGSQSGTLTSGTMTADRFVLGALMTNGALSNYFTGRLRAVAFFQNLANHRPLSDDEISRIRTWVASA